MNMLKNPADLDAILRLRKEICDGFALGLTEEVFRLSALIDEIQLRVWTAGGMIGG